MGKKKPLEPEVVEELPQGQDITLRQPPEVLVEVSSRPAPFPFLNRFEKKRIESFTEVVGAEKNLMAAIGDHSRTKARLKDIDIEIETDRLERELKLKEVEREVQLQKRKDRLAELELEVQEAELLKKLSELRQTSEKKEETKAERLKRELKAKLETEQIYQDYDIDKAKLKVSGEFKTKQALKEARSEAEQKIKQDQNLSQEEKERMLENLEDYYNQMLDKM